MKVLVVGSLKLLEQMKDMPTLSVARMEMEWLGRENEEIKTGDPLHF